MSILHLTAGQRHRLRASLQTALEVDHYRRVFALLELDRGEPVVLVADRLGVSRQSVYNWAACFRDAPGPAALRPHRSPGRPSLWTPELRYLLRSALRRRPDQLGRVGLNWTVPLLREYLLDCGGQALSEDSIRRELDRLGYVWKRPRYVLPPDPEREKKNAQSASDWPRYRRGA